MSDCPWCCTDIGGPWFDAGAEAGAYECPECGAELCAVTTDNGWQSSVRFDQINPPPDEEEA